MISTVTKSDGSEEDFDGSKLRMSIQSAAEDSGLPEDEISELIDSVLSDVLSEFDEKENASTSDIRRVVLEELDSQAPEVAEAWREYDSERGKE